MSENQSHLWESFGRGRPKESLRVAQTPQLDVPYLVLRAVWKDMKNEEKIYLLFLQGMISLKKSNIIK